MGQLCYLCRRKASRRDRISLHKFPKNPIMRNKWIKSCDLSLSDNLTCIYICSLHFNPKDIDRGNEFQTRCILKASAVPSIGVPNQICSNFNNENSDPVVRDDGTKNNGRTNEEKTTNSYKKVNELDNIVDNASTCDNVFGNMHVQELQLFTQASIKQYDDFIKRRQLVNADATLKCEENEDVKKLEESYSTKSKRRDFERRYVSQIRIPDLGILKRTRRILNFVRDTNEKKSKLTKSLQDRKRKLEKRISSLEEIIAHLKMKNMVPNETLLVQYYF